MRQGRAVSNSVGLTEEGQVVAVTVSQSVWCLDGLRGYKLFVIKTCFVCDFNNIRFRI